MASPLARNLAAATFAALLILTLAPAASAAEPDTSNITSRFAGLDINAFAAYDVGGIVILRGRTLDKAKAAEASVMAAKLGYTRVANLIQVTPPADDEAIERRTERSLAMNHSLDGCQIHIDSEQGVVHLAGTVKSEIQKDIAVATVRGVDGVVGVTSELKK